MNGVRSTFVWPTPVPASAHVATMQPTPVTIPEKETEDA